MQDDEFKPPDLQEEDEEDENDWITTFADMSMLLLVFFILLFSMSRIDVKRFTDSFTSVRQALGDKLNSQVGSKVGMEDGSLVESILMQKQLIISQRKIYTDIRTFLNRKGLEGVIGSVFDEGTITLKVPSWVLFDKGQVTMSPEGEKVLLKLKNIFIKRNDQTINIRGYTDDMPPPQGSRFLDNWEISAMRAVNVLRFYLKQGIEPSRLTATGLADLNPIVPNDTPENRALNRRVEFVLDKRITRN